MSTAGPPAPPANFQSRKLPLRTLPAGTLLHRFYSRTREPIHFGRAKSGRFDAPDSSYGVLYVALDVEAAFAETFLRSPGATLIAQDMLRAKAYAVVRLQKPLKVVSFVGKGLANLGATAEVSHRSAPYDVPQAWSAAIHRHAQKPDGLVYSARHDDSAHCLCVFERAKPALIEERRETNLDVDWFWLLAEQYGLGLAP